MTNQQTLIDLPTSNTFKIAINTGIVARPGAKPDFGTGLPKSELNEWQIKTRRELTYKMQNVEFTPEKIARVIRFGGTLTAWHTGGKGCKAQFEIRGGETVRHECKNGQHRCNANFICAQHLGADFDKLSNEDEIFNNPLVKKYGSIIYHTPSSKPDNPKMRVIFLLDQLVREGPLYRQMVKAMLWKFEGAPDPACTDYCRLFFGNQGCETFVTDKVLPISVAHGWLADYERHIELSRPPKTPTRLFSAGQSLSPQEERRIKAFGGAVLNRACDRVRGAITGERHYALKKAAFHVGTFIAGGVIDEMEARRELEQAYRTHVTTPVDMVDLIEWAFLHARDYPQGLPEETEVVKSQRRADWYASRGYRYAV